MTEQFSVLVSVIIPAYNREDVIQRAITSILQQNCTFDFEVIVVDDGSTDMTCDRVKALNDQRVRLIKQTNQGASAARINGVEHARGDLVAFLDSDDIAELNYLQTLRDKLATTPDALVAYAKVGELDGSWHAEQQLPPTDTNGLLVDPLVALLTFGCFTISMNLMAKRKAALHAMAGRHHVLASNDFDFCLRLAVQGPYVFADAITIRIDRRNDGIGKKFGYRQVSFAVVVACEAVQMSGRRDKAVKTALKQRVQLLWPTAFGQCLAHHQWLFAWKVFMCGLRWGSIKNIKALYWAIDYYVLKGQA